MLTFGDIFQFVGRHKYKFVLTMAAGAGIALIAALSLPRQWEASTVLQIGQVYYNNGKEQPQAMPIELPSRALERMKLGQFQDAVLRRLSLPIDLGASDESELIRRSATPRLIRNAELVEISVRGFSPADAKRYVEAYQNELIGAHQKLAQPSMERIAAETTQTQWSLAKAEKRQQDLQQLADERLKMGASDKFSESVLLSDLIGKNDEELRSLRQRRVILSEESNPQRTFNTRPLSDIDVGKRPVWPKKSSFMAAGGAIGLVIGLAWALWQERRRRQA
ncbi:conserved hypothetical protein [Cupriavidus taiwanensis]|nr:conserved hypothetical protein [Cupriavidus taiwanensis]SOZ24611.1 conserved hypothetical protein [Cupriavidus taiwanensis]SOZ44513.1 conserved hypothetical protein [Cupriavidus taiwanensis]